MTGKQLLLYFVLIAPYFVPSLAARSRRHRAKDAIMLVNLLFGWTIIGWLIALIWSQTQDNRPKSLA